MSSQIVFMDKNKVDVENTNATITATQGSSFIQFVRNRSNRSAWVTNGSVDADNTEIEIDFGDSRTLDIIILVTHNFKAYTMKYWNGAIYVDFSTAVNVTGNLAESTSHEFTLIATQKIKIIITETTTGDEEKFLYQLIASSKIGRLNGWPKIGNPTFDKQKKRNKMLSGKENIIENLGGFSVNLSLDVYSNEADLDVFEELYDSPEGFLVWLCGGDEAQFSNVRMGYRMRDVFLMRTASNYRPEFYKGSYQSGIIVDVPLVEVIT